VHHHYYPKSNTQNKQTTVNQPAGCSICHISSHFFLLEHSGISLAYWPDYHPVRGKTFDELFYKQLMTVSCPETAISPSTEPQLSLNGSIKYFSLNQSGPAVA
jgi:hypothetical protein